MRRLLSLYALLLALTTAPSFGITQFVKEKIQTVQDMWHSSSKKQNPKPKAGKKKPKKKKNYFITTLVTLATIVLAIVVGKRYADGNQKQTKTGLERLKELAKEGHGQPFSESFFIEQAKPIITQLESDKPTVQNLEPLFIDLLVKNSMDLTKTSDQSPLSKYWINQIEDLLLDESLCAADSALILDTLLAILTKLVGPKAVQEMLNEPLNKKERSHDTVLHKLIACCNTSSDASQSANKDFNFLPHIQVCLSYGANPEIKDQDNKSAIQLGENKNIDSCHIKIAWSNLDNKWQAEFASRAKGGQVIDIV